MIKGNDIKSNVKYLKNIIKYKTIYINWLILYKKSFNSLNFKYSYFNIKLHLIIN